MMTMKSVQFKLPSATALLILILAFTVLCLIPWSSLFNLNIITVNPLDMILMEKSCKRLPIFMGRQPIDETERTISDLEKHFGDQSSPGGRFLPDGCHVEGRTAIIIPYRDRRQHLTLYLYNVIPKLIRQRIDFTIFVIEQSHSAAFNRGMMRNVGFEEAKKEGPFDCFIFNDVDTIIEDDRNMFYCNPFRVRHLASSISRYQYSMPSYILVGGIIAFTKMQFELINGYSNMFFLWGGEDDDVYRRLVEAGCIIERPPDPIGSLTTFSHTHDDITDNRYKTSTAVKNYHKFDGLRSLEYKVLSKEQRTLFTWITVDVDEDRTKKQFLTNFLNS